MKTATYVYSVIRAVPRPRRDETVNVGVVVLAADGTFSDAKLGPLDRVRKLDPDADVRSIELFLSGIASRLPLHGRQQQLAPSGDLSVDLLRQWSREFGGCVRLSEPRAALADDGSRLLKALYEDFVGPAPRLQKPEARLPRAVMRPDILSALDRTLVSWNVAPEAVETNSTVHGRRARHVVDRAYFGSRRTLAAVAQAISFQARDLGEVFGHRATIIVAAEDLHEQAQTTDLPVFAVHSDAPAERLEAVQESAQLFNARQVTPVRVTDLAAIRHAVDSLLHLS